MEAVESWLIGRIYESLEDPMRHRYYCHQNWFWCGDLTEQNENRTSWRRVCDAHILFLRNRAEEELVYSNWTIIVVNSFILSILSSRFFFFLQVYRKFITISLEIYNQLCLICIWIKVSYQLKILCAAGTATNESKPRK